MSKIDKKKKPTSKKKEEVKPIKKVVKKKTTSVNELPLPRYKSKKVVKAGKILSINGVSPAILTVDVGKGMDISVERSYVKKHDPYVGGYYVCYEDGYESFSP